MTPGIIDAQNLTKGDTGCLYQRTRFCDGIGDSLPQQFILGALRIADEITDPEFWRDRSSSQGVQYDGSVPQLSTTKTDAGIRDIPLLPQLKAILTGRHGQVLPGNRDGGFVSETQLRQLVTSYNNLLSTMANGGIQRR